VGKIKFIYFDVGEVLIKGAHSKDIATFLGIPYETFRPVFKKYQHDALTGKITSEEFLEYLKKELPLHPKLVNFPALWIETISPIKKSIAFFQEISKTHHIGYLTNLFTDLFDELKKRSMIPNAKNTVLIGSWEVGLRKPDKAIYLLAQEKAGVNPEEILLVDDNKENIKAAEEIGWKGIVFDPNHPVESINKIKQLL